MANRYLDSCGDHYDTSHLLAKWDAIGTWTSAGSSYSVNASGRNGKCIEIHSTGGAVYLRKNHTSDVGHMFYGFAFKCDNLPGAGYLPIFGISKIGTLQCGLYIDSAGRIGAGWSSNGSSQDFGAVGQKNGESAPGTITNSQWYYIEYEIVADNATVGPVGVVNVWVNNVQVVNVTASRTAYNNTLHDQFNLMCNVFPGYYFDDIYANDATGASNNGRLGDVKVLVIKPDGAGAATNWTPNTGANYDAVNDAIPDDDTTYVASATPGTQDLYTFEDLPVTVNAVYAVQSVLYARKDDSASRVITVKVADNTGAGATTTGKDHSVSNTYQFWLAPMDNYVVDGTQWTPAKVNAMQAGPYVVS